MLVKSVDCSQLSQYGPPHFQWAFSEKNAFWTFSCTLCFMKQRSNTNFPARLPVHLRNTPLRTAPGSAVREVLSGSFLLTNGGGDGGGYIILEVSKVDGGGCVYGPARRCRSERPVGSAAAKGGGSTRAARPRLPGRAPVRDVRYRGRSHPPRGPAVS